MTLISNRPLSLALMCIWIAGVGLIGSALSQPGPGAPGPGGGGGGPGAPGGGPGGGPGAPGAPSPTVALRLCNKTKEPVLYAATVSIVGQQFRAQGWAQIKGGECIIAGSFERPKAWWYVRSPSGTSWGKAAVDICVNLNDGFDYTWPGSGRDCLPNETLVGFKEENFLPTQNENLQNMID